MWAQCITQLFLLVHVLGVRTAPASTLPVHFGLAGRHLVVSCLSTLPLGTEILPWLLDYTALPQGFVQFLFSDLGPSILSHLVRPVKSYVKAAQVTSSHFIQCALQGEAVSPPPPGKEAKKKPILLESLGTDTIRSNEVLWTFHEQSTGLF